MTARNMPFSLLASALVFAGTTDVAAGTANPPSRRWIAVTTAVACPQPLDDTTSPPKHKTATRGSATSIDRWSSAPAFTRPGRLSKDIALPPSLSRFCVYTRATPSANPPRFSAEAQPSIARIDADYDVLIPQAGPLPSNSPPDTDIPTPQNNSPHTDVPAQPSNNNTPNIPTWKQAIDKVHATSAALFAETVGVTSSNQRQDIYTSKYEPAYLAIVDTASAASTAAFARHGQAMAAIAGAVRCPMAEKGCSDYTLFEQAYSYTNLARAIDQSSPQLGGMVSLAQAIWRTVDTWRASRSGGSSAPLVLNLSLGWDPARFGTIPDELVAHHLDLLRDTSAGAAARGLVPAPVQVIHAALVHASCLEALMIAAAGNRLVDECDAQGPLNPAQWERLAAPTRSECKDLYADTWLESPRPGLRGRFARPRSLVYAVGGLTVGPTTYHGDIWVPPTVLPMARPRSAPARLVSASQAVARWQNQWTEAWSGTSVAAAVYSGLAAALWTQRPELTPHELVSTIDTSGYETMQTDFPASGKKASRIDGNRAYTAVCKLGTAGSQRPCDANPYLPHKPERRLQLLTAYADAVTSLPLLTNDSGDVTLTTDILNLKCSQRTHHHPADKPSPPSTAYPLPWVRPQPETPLCPVCPIKGGKLLLSLNPAVRGTYLPANGPITLVDPTLQFGTTSVNLGDLRLDNNGLKIDLSRYKIGKTTTLVDMLPTSGDGTLSVTIIGIDGKPVALTSVVQVLQVLE